VTRFSNKINYQVNQRKIVSRSEQQRLNKFEKSGQIFQQKFNEKNQITYPTIDQSQRGSESQKWYKSDRIPARTTCVLSGYRPLLSSYDIDSLRTRTRTSAMPARNPTAYQCYLCKHFSAKHFELLRHLATHGVDEDGVPLSDLAKAKYKWYNTHKLKPKKSPKSKPFLVSTLETDTSTTTTVVSPLKRTKTASPQLVQSTDVQLADDLLLSDDSSSEEEAVSSLASLKTKSPIQLLLQSRIHLPHQSRT